MTTLEGPGRGTITLVRHGATEWSEAGKHTGRTDLPLTEKGETQAKSLVRAFATMPAETKAHVFSSPLKRAHRTGMLAGFEGRIETSELLLEMDYGADEGRTRAEIRKERPTWDVFDGGPLRGETPYEVAARAARFLTLTRELEGGIVLFSHGHYLRIFACVYLGVSPLLAAKLDLGPASVSVLGHMHDDPAIVRWNDRSHVA